MEPYLGNVDDIVNADDNFRRVVFTGEKSQLVVMHIPVGGEIGEETHDHVEQTLYFQTGEGEAILNGKTTSIKGGDMAVVTPGTRHNFRNTGDVPLEVITVYTPPNHFDGRVHATKADAEADKEDEAFGHEVE